MADSLTGTWGANLSDQLAPHSKRLTNSSKQPRNYTDFSLSTEPNAARRQAFLSSTLAAYMQFIREGNITIRKRKAEEFGLELELTGDEWWAL